MKQKSRKKYKRRLKEHLEALNLLRQIETQSTGRNETRIDRVSESNGDTTLEGTVVNHLGLHAEQIN